MILMRVLVMQSVRSHLMPIIQQVIIVGACALFLGRKSIPENGPFSKVGGGLPNSDSTPLAMDFTRGEPHDLERLHYFDRSGSYGITPQVEFGKVGEYSLRYVLSEAEDSVTTVLDKGIFGGFRVSLERKIENGNGFKRLLCGVRGTSYFVTLALWTYGTDGKVLDAWVRIKPFVLIRTGEPRSDGRSYEVLWKPIVAGKGIGEWIAQ